jgi:hypothetical protein
MPEPEFKVGDTVHYRGAVDHPADGIPAIVRDVWVGIHNGCHLDGTPDDRIFYALRASCDRNNPHTRNVVADCTGRSIVESSLYAPPEY